VEWAAWGDYLGVRFELFFYFVFNGMGILMRGFFFRLTAYVLHNLLLNVIAPLEK
jgi:hypothetical protein